MACLKRTSDIRTAAFVRFVIPQQGMSFENCVFETSPAVESPASPVRMSDVLVLWAMFDRLSASLAQKKQPDFSDCRNSSSFEILLFFPPAAATRPISEQHNQHTDGDGSREDNPECISLCCQRLQATLAIRLRGGRCRNLRLGGFIPGIALRRNLRRIGGSRIVLRNTSAEYVDERCLSAQIADKKPHENRRNQSKKQQSCRRLRSVCTCSILRNLSHACLRTSGLA